jgi:hypothetical protein
MARQASCQSEQLGIQGCRSMNAMTVERTLWPTYEVQRIRLCSKCRAQLGFAAPGKPLGNRYRLTDKAGGDRTHASD